MKIRTGRMLVTTAATPSAVTTAVHAGPDLPDAACGGAAEPLWDYLLDGETAAQQDARHRRAKAVCAACPELLACLRARRDDPTLPPGIWGGCLVGAGPKRTYLASPIRVGRRSA